jgi:hypothetical protein
MKSKLRLMLSVTIVGLIGSAYATCYLPQVVVCLGLGDSPSGNFVKTCSGSGTVTYAYQIVADETAYRTDVYSVTRGGYDSHDIGGAGYYCDGSSQDSANFNTSPSSVGFLAHYIDPCNGSRITGVNNASGSTPFTVTFSSPSVVQTTSMACH